MVNVYENDDYERNELLAVGVTQVLISRKPASGKRKSITITNTSPGAQKITIHKGIGLAVANQGIVLQPTGAWSDTTINEYAKCFQGTISVISDVAAGQVSVSEEME